jgi:selenocysteine-specific elongation factor
VAATVGEKNAAGYFRLPVDRVFTVKGFGTVATGTLISGSVAREQEVEVYPAGRRLRVRGVQVHGSAAGRAIAGQRTAVNLADIEPADLARGDVLSEPGRFHAVKQIDCRLDLLASAKPLKHRAPVHFHSGTAEIEAEVRLLEGGAAMRPGSTAYVRLILRHPALLLPGDGFIIRMFSPVVTIGGGVVVDIQVDTGGRRHRKGDEVKARLETLCSGTAAARIALLVREAAFGMGMAELVARTGMREPEIAAAAAQTPLVAIAQPQPWYVDRAWMQAERERIVRTVREFHQRSPLLPGVARQELRGGAPVFVLDALLAESREIGAEGELVRSRGHKVVLKEDEEQARAKIERAFEDAALAVPALAEVLAKSGVEAARARSLLQILLREKRLVRISDELVFHHTAIARLRELLGRHKGERFRVPEFKEWTGISRKYAIPLLEFLDRERITRREADERVVL